MSQNPICFEFADSAAAALALETLTELGYHAHAVEAASRPGLALYMDQNDLTSALEIAQANGGRLADTETAKGAMKRFESAYGLDEIFIPAHLVNEDWSESYFTATE